MVNLAKFDQFIERLDKMAEAVNKLSDLAEKLPKLIGMGGLAMFAGKASERLGGKFLDGAVGGATVFALADTSLPHNQIGGLALGTYIAGVGVVNLVPDLSGNGNGDAGGQLIATTRIDCRNRGGTEEGALTPLTDIGGDQEAVFCRLPFTKEV